MNLLRDLVLFPLLLCVASTTIAKSLEAKSNPSIPLERYQLANGLRVWHQY